MNGLCSQFDVSLTHVTVAFKLVKNCLHWSLPLHPAHHGNIYKLIVYFFMSKNFIYRTVVLINNIVFYFCDILATREVFS